MSSAEKFGAALWIRLARFHGLALREVRPLPAQSGLTLPQFDVLAQLLRHDGPMTASELSKALLVTAGNITGILDRLRNRGLVRRAVNPDDRRVRYLSLTEDGRQIAQLEVARQEQQLNRLFGPLSSRERDELCRLLDILRRPLQGEHDGAESQ